MIPAFTGWLKKLIMPTEECCSYLGLEISMFHPQPSLAPALRLGQDHERGKQT
jgi:hypothetical protein